VQFLKNQLLIAPQYRDDPTAAPLPFRPSINSASMGSYSSEPTELLRVSNGWFLAYNHGEFGGSLWFFSSDGSVGRLLLKAPTYDLTRYGREIIAETGLASPFFFAPARLHRFALQGDKWVEVSHTDFADLLTPIWVRAQHLYAMESTYSTQTLVKIDLAGSLRKISTVPRDLAVPDIAMSGGDVVLGAAGYVVLLHARGPGFVAAWFAPRDCVHYAIDENDPTDEFYSRCVGMPGVQSYRRRTIRPMSQRALYASEDGAWLADARHLVHWTGQRFENIDPPSTSLKNDPLLQLRQVLTWNEDVILQGGPLWRRHDGRWVQSEFGGSICLRAAVAESGSIWCVLNTAPKGAIGIVGLLETKYVVPRSSGEIHDVVAGARNDAWFSEDKAPYIVHVLSDGSQSEMRVSSPVLQWSHSPMNHVSWFSEADGHHIGLIDARNEVHEYAMEHTSVRADLVGAWVGQFFAGTHPFVRHVDASGKEHVGAYAQDARSWLVTSGGALWVTSTNWPTIERQSESGDEVRYLLPCSDGRVRLLPAPNNFVWFLSLEHGCSGLIDATGVHTRELPLVEWVQYR
jgi:hypothetical protein